MTIAEYEKLVREVRDAILKTIEPHHDLGEEALSNLIEVGSDEAVYQIINLLSTR